MVGAEIRCALLRLEPRGGASGLTCRGVAEDFLAWEAKSEPNFEGYTEVGDKVLVTNHTPSWYSFKKNFSRISFAENSSIRFNSC